MTQHNFTRIYLSMTIEQDGHSTTWPLTPMLLAMWLLAAMPLVADCFETASRAVSHIDSAVSALVITILSFIFIMEVRACSLS